MDIEINEAQEEALKKVFERRPLWGATCMTSDTVLQANGWTFNYNPQNTELHWWEHPKYGKHEKVKADTIAEIRGYYRRATYEEFRAQVKGTFGCDGAITVPWAGMWLCIERDGYTHS